MVGRGPLRVRTEKAVRDLVCDVVSLGILFAADAVQQYNTIIHSDRNTFVDLYQFLLGTTRSKDVIGEELGEVRLGKVTCPQNKEAVTEVQRIDRLPQLPCYRHNQCVCRPAVGYRAKISRIIVEPGDRVRRYPFFVQCCRSFPVF